MNKAQTKTKKAKKGENPMRQVKVAKLTLNIGAGTDQKELERGMKLLEHITGITPVKTHSKKRIPGWGLRPGLPIGCKITIRGKKALELIPNLLEARENKLPESCFDNHGNISFGIKEYIDIGNTKYEPSIGMMGLQTSITLERAGYRVHRKRIGRSKMSKNHRVSKEDAIEFMKSRFNTEAV